MAGAIDISFETKELTRALELYQEATGKDAADIVNRMAKDACFKAASKTKKVRKARIDKHDPTKRPSKYPNRLFYAVAAKRGPLRKTQGQISRQKADGGVSRRVFKGGREERALQYFNQAQQSRGYIAAGWLGVLRKMGVNTKIKPSEVLIRDALWRPATPNNPVAIIGNGANRAEEFGVDGLRAGLKFAAADKKKYALKKLAKTAEEFSGR